MKSEEKKFQKTTFSIIKHHNSPNSATTLDGHSVIRKKQLWIQEYKRFVICAPYDNHFIYEDPSKKAGRWVFMCTCGSPAVIVGSSVYSEHASPTSGDGIVPGEMLVCKMHMDRNKHADGST